MKKGPAALGPSLPPTWQALSLPSLPPSSSLPHAEAMGDWVQFNLILFNFVWVCLAVIWKPNDESFSQQAMTKMNGVSPLSSPATLHVPPVSSQSTLCIPQPRSLSHHVTIICLYI